MKFPKQIRFITRGVVLFALSSILAATAYGSQESRLDHRDDYRMDSISGGDFRDYISSHITESDRWARSMRTFGSFHNHMHELMSYMGRYGAQERGDQVPAFSNRISGGDWTEYRKALEKAEDDSAWYELVRITEIMHDRVHHAMARSLIRDQDARDREVDLDDYLRAKPLKPGEGIPSKSARNITVMSLDQFRERAWGYDTESRYLHQSVQSMIVFAHMLDDLLTQWLVYAETLDSKNCRPRPGLSAERGEGWSDYIAQIGQCDDVQWREFVLVAGLMRDRIHHMMHKMAAYEG